MTENMQARWVQSLFAVFVRCCLKEIGQQAFQQCQKLNGITIPDGVIEIKAATFRECKNLSYAIIGDGVRIIDDQAFYLCPNLNTVKIGKSVKSVGDTAFEGCSIKSVYIDSLDIWCDINFEDPTSVPGGTLYIENTPISTVVISSPTQSIRNYAFYRRKELNEVVIQNGITSI